MKGYGALVAGFVMAVVLISVAAALVAAYVKTRSMVERAGNFAAYVKQVEASEGIKIVSYEWNAEENMVHILAQNVGTLPIDLNTIAVFVNHVFVGRCGVISCLDDTNNGVLSPNEYLHVSFPYFRDAASVTISADKVRAFYRNWVNGCKYRRVVLVYNPHTSALSGYQVHIELNDINYTLDPDGNVVFADTDGTTILPSWVEYWDVNGLSKVWVRTDLPALNRKNIYLYYGCTKRPTFLPSDVFLRDINGLVAAWLFDENGGVIVHDLSGNGHDGNIFGSGVQWVTGKYGSGLYFPGNDTNYVVIAPSPDFDISNNITIMAWVYREWRPATGSWALDNYGLFSVEYSYKFLPDYAGTLWYGVSSAAGWQSIYTTSVQVPFNEWNFVALSFSQPNIVFWVNDNNEENTFDYNALPTGLNEYIGKTWNGEPFKGVIDEMFILDHALSARDILLMYENRGYATPFYRGHLLIRKYVQPEPSVSIGAREVYATS